MPVGLDCGDHKCSRSVLTGEFLMESSDFVEQKPQNYSGLVAKLKYRPRMEPVCAGDLGSDHVKALRVTQTAGPD